MRLFILIRLKFDVLLPPQYSYHFCAMKFSGEIGISNVWATIQENPTATFDILYVRANSDGILKPKGQVIEQRIRYGAPIHEKKRIPTKIGGVRKVSRHDTAGTMPVTDVVTGSYKSLLITHIVGFKRELEKCYLKVNL
jgi:hypothetical protein